MSTEDTAISNFPEHRENEVYVASCESWQDFIREARKPRLIVNAVYPEKGEMAYSSRGTALPTLFRGHADPSWKLSSPLERNYEGWGGSKDNWDQHCERILSSFKDKTRGMPEVQHCQTDEDYWAVGRHAGLITPLLDWSESPFVAAYFALSDAMENLEVGEHTHRSDLEDENGNPLFAHVWGLQRYAEVNRLRDFRVINPASFFNSSHRNQQGVFTQSDNKDYLDLKSFFEAEGVAHSLELYKIPLKDARIAFRDLHLMNIRPSTLFPNVTGAAKEASTNWSRMRNAADSVTLVPKDSSKVTVVRE